MKYAFKGDETIGKYVIQQLDASGFEKVDELSKADAILVHCYSASALEDVYFEDNGLIKEAKPGALIINLSPSTPNLAREITAVASVNDLCNVEAPLAFIEAFTNHSLSDPAEIMCYLGGEVQDCAEARTFVEPLASLVIESGDVGSAQLAKVLYTIRQAAHIVAAVEEHALYHALHEQRYDTDQREFPLGREDAVFANLSDRVAQKDYVDGFTTAFLMSDVVSAMAAADDAELILPQLESALHILELFGVIGGADMGVSALALLYRDEQDGSEAGLDWSRAEKLYAEARHASEEMYEDDDDFDFGDNIDFFSN